MTQEEPEPPIPIELFLTANYKLLTVVSVFAALTAYLTQLPSTGTTASYGVGGSLLMLFVSGWIMFRKTIRELAKGFRGTSIQHIPRTFGYATFMWGFFGILAALFAIMAKQFPNGAGTLIGNALLFPILSVYLSLMFWFIGYEGNSNAQYIVKSSPILWLVIFLVLLEFGSSPSSQYSLSHPNPSTEFGYRMAALFMHGLGTFLIATLGLLLDRGKGYFSGLKSQYFSN